jgi:hypothetical protein
MPLSAWVCGAFSAPFLDGMRLGGTRSASNVTRITARQMTRV